MIAFLQGNIKKKLEKSIIIDVNNVGYLVHVPVSVMEKISEKEETGLYIHTKVREDDISLFGFETMDELEFFKTLIGISGVGPKLAIEILSQKIEAVKSALISGDVHFLSKIPGIGKKTAERLIVELKNKVDWDGLSSLHTQIYKDIDDDAVNALISLGYQKYEINRVLRRIPPEIKEVEEIVTYFLQNI
jgi:Holliday junction DNA helicase RuvA